ncbi:MAG TPA: dihydrolipoamide acetyltransferase family protein [Nocardioides sp.]|nr:dihydrolipoamide acetyltransferase family protein [Nocardioides sp.]
MPEYKLPDVGEGLTEAEIVAWRVKVGDEVAINDVVVEIETAKSIVELPSPYAGTVTALLVAEGETVPVGTPIIAIGADSDVTEEAAPAAAPTSSAPIDTNVPPEGNATLVGYGPKEAALKRRPRRFPTPEMAARAQAQASFIPASASPMVEAEEARAEPHRPSRARSHAAPSAPGVEEGRPAARHETALAKPPVRKLAKDLGVDLASLVGSGPDGVVTRGDVEAAAGAAESAGLGTPSLVPRETYSTTDGGLSGPRETREPVKGVRKMMAAAMVQSAFTAPHVTEWVTVDATATVELVERLRSRPELRDVKVSPLLVVARAAILAMRRSPTINSTWDDAADEVVVKHYVNLGIAAATPRGLVVPNVKDAQACSLAELARELETLTATAREGRTQPAEMAGGTFTITNVGVFGVDGGTPIINPGESAILCMGAIKPQPWVVGDQVVPRQAMTLSLSFDHRHIDGATGSRFLADVAGMVADPATALLF